jgi:glycosyltransferase involved in cell wall biosynthesis
MKENQNKELSFSIIIATYNAQQYLQKCLDSIINQLNDTAELIIIDGASKDGTLEILKKNSQYFSYFTSEPDDGIYDAWNKGIKNATSEWVMFLGADDVLLPNALNLYSELIKKCDDNISIISSKVRMVSFAGKELKIIGEKWDWNKYKKGTYSLAHPGMLHKKSLFEKYGYYDTQFKICSDSDFLLRAGKNLKGEFTNSITVNMQEGGVSDSFKAIWESYLIRKKNKTIPLRHNVIRFLWICGLLAYSRIKKKLR